MTPEEQAEQDLYNDQAEQDAYYEQMERDYYEQAMRDYYQELEEQERLDREQTYPEEQRTGDEVI